ncbi:uncharacterized protein LOC105692736 [Athalia rosae]|uniref:uncharacterized protein LOC105692736 n=1 Tax=Athalia rosae TaxID=37344 RepID=UPI000626CE6E|nr:uncharacterized protein LOC105692736 [Athalia rosae]
MAAIRMSAVLQVTLLVLAAVLHQGSALRCWECSSNSSPECGDPITDSEHHQRFHTKDCDATLSQHPYSYEKSVCRKTVQRSNGKKVVIRACAIPYPDERDITDGVCSTVPTASHITIESCHVCTTDLCNGAHSALGQVTAIKSLLFFGIPSVLFAYRWSY